MFEPHEYEQVKSTKQLWKEIKPDIEDLCSRLEIPQEQLIGDYKDYGRYRRVHYCPHNDEWVIKIEHLIATEPYDFMNAHEFNLYAKFKYFKKYGPKYTPSIYPPKTVDHVLRWLAPCYYISKNSRIIIQQQVDLCDNDEFKQTKIPTWLSDTFYDNFGWYKGKLVCFDYPNVNPKFSRTLI